MGVSDDGNDPVTLPETWRPCTRVQRSEQDVVALVVPGGARAETQFNLVGVRAFDRTGPLQSIRERQRIKRKQVVVSQAQGG